MSLPLCDLSGSPGVVQWQNQILGKAALHQSMAASSQPDMEGGQLKEALKGVGLPCGVCGAPKSDVTLQPCQHKCVCSTCSAGVKKCPLCDEDVKDTIHTGPGRKLATPVLILVRCI